MVLALATGGNAAGYKAGSTVNVNGIYYYIPATSVSSLAISSEQLKSATTSGEDFVPLTVLSGGFTTLSSDVLKSTVAKFQEEDDVFSLGFLQGML